MVRGAARFDYVYAAGPYLDHLSRLAVVFDEFEHHLRYRFRRHYRSHRGRLATRRFLLVGLRSRQRSIDHTGTNAIDPDAPLGPILQRMSQMDHARLGRSINRIARDRINPSHRSGVDYHAAMFAH